MAICPKELCFGAKEEEMAKIFWLSVLLDKIEGFKENPPDNESWNVVAESDGVSHFRLMRAGGADILTAIVASIFYPILTNADWLLSEVNSLDKWVTFVRRTMQVGVALLAPDIPERSGVFCKVLVPYDGGEFEGFVVVVAKNATTAIDLAIDYDLWRDDFATDYRDIIPIIG